MSSILSVAILSAEDDIERTFPENCQQLSPNEDQTKKSLKSP